MMHFVRPSLGRKSPHILNMTSKNMSSLCNTELDLGEFLSKWFCVYLHLSYARRLLFKFCFPFEAFPKIFCSQKQQQ